MANRTPTDVLGRQALNRALLERQMLLARRSVPVGEALEHLVGVQAQAPDAPYVGLWSRLAGFEATSLAEDVNERRAVRMPLMRATIHLVTARDARALRPVVQPALERSFAGSEFARELAGVDVEDLHAVGRALVEERPRTRAQLVPLLAERWPDHHPTSLVYSLTYRVPLVQVPPRGVWGSRGPAAWTTVSSWLGDGADPTASVDDLVLRYLAAFGPATVKDVQTWSGLARLRDVTDRLGSRLRRFRDESGAELVDLPDAPRPDPGVPAPPRFLPEYDNVLLSHADRTRINPDGRRVPLPPGNGAATGTILVDGLFRGTWDVDRATDGSAATLTVRPFTPLSQPEADAVTKEAAALVAFLAPTASSDVRIG
jgi:winged helix DNA-binding protein